jgi:Domain of unknown function (DUF4326)
MTTPKRVKVPGPFRYRDLPAGVVYVGRAVLGYPGSPYANPFKPAAKTPQAHAASVERYRQHLREHPELVAGIRRDIPAGASVACWCPDGWPCHGDVVLEVAAGARP